MNPEEYLKRTRTPQPGPFLRQNVLEEAERAWRGEPRRRSIRQVVFHPLTAAASLFFALGLALLSSEIDQRATASLIPAPNHSQMARGERIRDEELNTYRRPYQIWNDEAFDGLVWNGIIGSGRPLPEEARRERGT